MIVEAVELYNVLSHSSTRLRLPQGVTVIIGPNGAGKTSIIDAIGFALFGFHTRSGAGKPKNEHIVRMGASSARISVTFSHNGRRYRVERIVPRRGSAQAKLYEIEGNDKPRLMASGVRAVEAEIRRILGLPPSVARLVYITPQGKLEEILEADERSKIFNLVFGLESMEKAYNRLQSLKRIFETELRNLENSINRTRVLVDQLRLKIQELPALEEELRRAKEALHAIEAKLRELGNAPEKRAMLEKALRETEGKLGWEKARLERLKEEAARLEEKLRRAVEAEEELRRLGDPEELKRALARLEDVIRRYEAYRRLVEEKTRRLREAREAEKRLNELKDAVREYEEAKRRIEELEEEAREYHALRRRLESLEAMKRDAEEQLKRLEEEIRRNLAGFISTADLDYSDPEAIKSRFIFLEEKLEERIEKLRSTLEELEKRKTQLATLVNEKQNAVEAIGRAQGRCPVCGRKLTEEERTIIIKRLREEIGRLRLEISKIDKRIYTYKRELEDLEGKREVLRRLRTLVEDLLTRMYVERRKLEDIERERSSIQERYLASYAAYQEYSEAKQRLRELESLYHEYTRLSAVAEERARLEEEIGEIEAVIDELEEEAEEIAARMKLPGWGREALEELRSRIEEAAGLQVIAAEKPLLEKQLEALRREAEEARARISMLEDEAARLRRSLEEAEAAEREYMKLQREKERLSVSIENLESYVEKLRRDEELLRSMEAELKENEEKAAKLKKLINVIDRIRDALHPRKGAPARIRLQARALMERYLRDILERFNLDFVDVRLGDNLDVILVSREGEKTPAMLSGGERVALAIAYRLALARTAAGRLDSMIMDEPTVHLDEERRKELVNIIRYGLDAAGLRQLIIVSHDPEVEEAADYVVEVRKESGASRVTARETTGGLQEAMALAV